MWCFGEGTGWWPFFGGIWMILFSGGLIALIVWGVIRLAGRGDFTQKRGPLHTVEERYAKGEITREEFERYKKDLS